MADPKLRIVKCVTICKHGDRAAQGSTETFKDIEVRHSVLSVEELSRQALCQVSIVKLYGSPKIAADSRAFQDLMQFVEDGGTLWVNPVTALEQTDICAKFGVSYKQLRASQTAPLLPPAMPPDFFEINSRHSRTERHLSESV
jgi:hypothetical protein